MKEEALAKVVLHYDNTMMRSLIDRFGVPVRAKEGDDNRFQAIVNVFRDPNFTVWCLALMT